MNTRIGMAVLCLLLAVVGGSAVAVEQPEYRVELDAKPFQVRLYPPLLNATVRVAGTRDAAVSEGFRILAHYIFGGNRRGTKIAMTAPVLQTPADPPAPGRDPEQWDVSFILPAAYTLADLPATNDARIHFAEAPASRVAVITFSGFWSESNLRTHREELVAFLKSRRLEPISGPIYAFYDPPWTPWFMRTNEIQYRIAGTPGSSAGGGRPDRR
jgi:hypothetical protein